MHPGRFPHAIPLTAFHMVVSFVLSSVGYACFGKYAYPGMDIVKRTHGISCGSWHLCLFSSRSPSVVRTR